MTRTMIFWKQTNEFLSDRGETSLRFFGGAPFSPAPFDTDCAFPMFTYLVFPSNSMWLCPQFLDGNLRFFARVAILDFAPYPCLLTSISQEDSARWMDGMDRRRFVTDALCNSGKKIITCTAYKRHGRSFFDTLFDVTSQDGFLWLSAALLGIIGVWRCISIHDSCICSFLNANTDGL